MSRWYNSNGPTYTVDQINQDAIGHNLGEIVIINKTSYKIVQFIKAFIVGYSGLQNINYIAVPVMGAINE